MKKSIACVLMMTLSFTLVARAADPIPDVGQLRIEGSVAFTEGPAWHPSGNWIVLSRAAFLWIVKPDGSQLVPLGIAGTDPAWSRDGGRIAFTVDDPQSSDTGRPTPASGAGFGMRF